MWIDVLLEDNDYKFYDWVATRTACRRKNRCMGKSTIIFVPRVAV